MTEPTINTSPTQPTSGSRVTRYVLLTTILLGVLVAGVVLGVTVVDEMLNPRFDVTQVGGLAYDPPKWVSDFELTSDANQPFGMTDLLGKWTVVTFGYTNCPDFCPLTLARFREVKTLLGPDADLVQFVLVSVDGPRDTPAVLDAYLARFDEDFIGLTGTDDEIAVLQPDFGFFYERQTDTGSAASYLVDHSTRSYLIDPQGFLCLSWSYGTEPADIARSIQQEFEDNVFCTDHASA